MTILIDYSQVALANIFQFQTDLQKHRSSPDAVNIIRHAILTGVKFYKKKYGNQYGELVLACDGKNYWRKDIFPYYKAGRSKAREKSNLDWQLVFNTISQVRDEIAENFPYKVIHLDNVEGDDIIASICKWTQTNGMIDRGMFEEKQLVVIISSDGDFKQLRKYENVTQWSPIKKKDVPCDNPIAYVAEHIAKAGDDGIPNVLSPDNVFVSEGARQKKMMSSRLAEFIKLGRDACQTDEERRNWDRNNALINLDMIPENIYNKIISIYTTTGSKNTKVDVYNYLVKHRCRLLLDEIEEFF
jgi:hypothetical protein